jgi:hypothetical protein
MISACDKATCDDAIRLVIRRALGDGKVSIAESSTTMKQLVLSGFIATVLAGCMVMVPGHLYPVQGSLAAQTPVPIYKVTLGGVLESGTMSATLPDGEVCKGSWAPVRQNDPSAGIMSVE